jgi:hypothetical protein
MMKEALRVNADVADDIERVAAATAAEASGTIEQ